MRQNRFYFNGDLSGQAIELRDRTIVNQVKNVLRLRLGDKFSLFDGQGLELVVEIKDLRNELVELSVLEREIKKRSERKVCLYLAILKKENFELAVQKAVESGVDKIVPLITERTVKLGLKEERLGLIIKEASEQSGRVFLPELREPLTLAEAFDEVKDLNQLNIFCDLAQDPQLESLDNSKSVNIFIGPEGGWGPKEQELAQSLKLISYSLGENVLRAETGAIVATWLAVNKKL